MEVPLNSQKNNLGGSEGEQSDRKIEWRISEMEQGGNLRHESKMWWKVKAKPNGRDWGKTGPRKMRDIRVENDPLGEKDGRDRESNNDIDFTAVELPPKTRTHKHAGSQSDRIGGSIPSSSLPLN